jgi:hypothetical protein
MFARVAQTSKRLTVPPRGCRHESVYWRGVNMLVQMQAITGDDRYRPSQWLRRRAMLGMSATTPE